MADTKPDEGRQPSLSPAEEEQRIYAAERRSWLIWTFGIAGAIVAVIIAGTVAISPWPDPATTGSTPKPQHIDAPAP